LTQALSRGIGVSSPIHPSIDGSALRGNGVDETPAGAPNIRGKTVVFVILSEAKNLAVEIATADSSPPEGGSE
jgi:hypothetical protein